MLDDPIYVQVTNHFYIYCSKPSTVGFTVVLLNTEEAHRKLLCKCLPEATRFFYCNGKALVDSAVDPTKKRASPRL